MAEIARNAIPKITSRNWALQVGLLLTLLVLVLAVWGPRFSPADPLQESFIGEASGKFVRPPYAPNEVEGYPLGSDEFGRDVLSRILWGLRPTMILVAVVAALRLVLGIAFGLIAGWSSHWFSRVLDVFISGSLAIPVLFVALCVVAALASEWGVGAFIMGLVITGWAETARVVQQQTRTIKTQEFIESSRAMGANSGQLIISHIVPHVMPLVWIQMAFEVSATLLTVAALGFLGYFVNAIWIPGESDFIGIRASGQPELGQMLGASVRDQPWTAAFAGTMVFLVVLGFNLLGEGLRAQQNPELHRKRASKVLENRYGTWLEEQFYIAVSGWQRSATTGGAFALLAVVVLGGGWFLWNMQNNIIPKTKIDNPGGNLWAAAQRDAQGTFWSAFEGPRQPDIQWIFTEPGGFVGGPLVDADGNLFVSAHGGWVISLTSDGIERWRSQVNGNLLGWPALTGDGNVIAADTEGGLHAFDREGELLWTYASDPPDRGLTGPIVGGNGLIYYAVQNFLVALTPDGQRYWQILLPSFSFISPMPRLSADNRYLFFEDVVVDAETGVTLYTATGPPADKYIVGADGNTYLRENDRVLAWESGEEGERALTTEHLRLDVRAIAANFRFPFDAGVAPSGDVWLLYSSGFEYPRMVWVDTRSLAIQINDFPYRPGRIVGIDALGVAYLCGRELRQPPDCRATRLDTGTTLWRMEPEAGFFPVGGAVIENRLYVTMGEGYLYAIGE
jgi:ABC-type dipeptide/oligopeptide/nickel transport system permease subunit